MDNQLKILIKAKNDAKAALRDAKKDLHNLDSSANSSSKAFGLLASASKVAAAGVVAAGVAFAGFSAAGVRTAADLETARVGFITLLGSAQEADKVLNQIKEDAKKTPFELTGLIKANQQLTSVTKNGMRSEGILLNVGKALSAAGKGQAELDRLIANLQQIGTVGKITEMDVRQFGNAGVNVLEILADYYGTTKEKAGEMVKDSKDAFTDLEKAFEKAGSEGGRFSKAFENQAGTFNQLVSNMKDNFTIFASDFVKRTGIFDAAKDAISGLNDVVDKNKDSFINTFNKGIDKMIEVGRNIREELMPSFNNLVQSVRDNLIPVMKNWYEGSLRPISEALGGTLIQSIKIAMDSLAWMLGFLKDNKWVLDSVTIALAGIATAAALKGAASAFTSAMAVITTQAQIAAGQAGIGGVSTSMDTMSRKLSAGATLNIWTAGAIAALAVVQKMTDVLYTKLEEAYRLIDELERNANEKVNKSRAYVRSLIDETGNAKVSQQELSNAVRDSYIQMQNRDSLLGKNTNKGKTLFKRAGGGSVAPGESYTVGERSAETFIPNTRGRIMPQQAGTSSSKTTNVLSGNFYFQDAAASHAFWDRVDKTARLSKLGVAR